MAAEDFDYDVALSFAGEDRHAVEPIASSLKRHQVNVFYDAFEKGSLWGKDLYQHFSKVYFERSRFFVPFLSRAYAAKDWTAHELKSAQARAFQQKNKEYILPIRLDDTDIPGILPTIAYLKYDDHTPEEIVNLILEKLDQSGRSGVDLHQPAGKPSVFSGVIPKVRKTFTQREKDLFTQESFSLIMQYFDEGLKALASSDRDIEVDFQAIHRSKFVCTAYVKGDVVNRCKVWLGGGWSRSGNQISFYSAKEIDVNQDNSTNDSLTVTDNGHELLLERGHFMYSGRTQDDYHGTPKEAAEYLWQRFIEPLKHER
jgi:hypothetical protein